MDVPRAREWGHTGAGAGASGGRSNRHVRVRSASDAGFRQFRDRWAGWSGPGSAAVATVAPTALAVFVRCFLLLAPIALPAAAPDGAAVYREACAACHESGENRAPSLQALRQLSSKAILDSLRFGTMAYVGKTLPDGHAEAVASYRSAGNGSRAVGRRQSCPEASWSDPSDGPRWIGWGVDLANSRFQPAEFARLDASAVPRLRLRWVFGLPNSDGARGHPTIAGGRVFLGARNGRLYALDARSGCTVWQFKAQAEVRAAVALSRSDPDARYAAYFGDVRANMYAIDATSGKLLWRTRVDDHRAATITGSPVAHDGRVYVGVSSIEEFTGAFPNYPCCTFRGSVVALDAENGEQVWQTRTVTEEPRPGRTNNRGVVQYGPSGAAIWSAPTIDTRLGRLYVATGDNYSDPPTADSDAIITYDLATGARLWSRQFPVGDAYNMACNPRADPANCPEARGPDLDFGSSPILVELGDGGRLLVAGQKSGVVHAVDPDRDGAVVWQRRAGAGGMLGGIQYGPAADFSNVYVAVSDISFGRQRTPGGKTFVGPKPDSGGGITAYRLADGERLWHTPGFACPPGRTGCSPAQSAAVTVIPGVVFSGSLDGHIRAYAVDDGRVLWSYDTVREFRETVNGVPAKGGSLNGPGPVVVDGMLYVNSGYGQFGSMPGNAFLAFGVDSP